MGLSEIVGDLAQEGGGRGGDSSILEGEFFITIIRSRIFPRCAEKSSGGKEVRGVGVERFGHCLRSAIGA